MATGDSGAGVPGRGAGLEGAPSARRTLGAHLLEKLVGSSVLGRGDPNGQGAVDRGCAARGARAGRGPGLSPGVTSCFPVPGRGAVGRTPVPEGPAGAPRPAVHSPPSGTCGFGGPGLEPGRAARSRSPPSGFLPFFLWGWVLAGFPVFTEVCFTSHLKQSFA